MKMADRIESLRKEKGISQEELADRVGVSRQAVSKWESEQSTPDVDKIITMSEYFGVTTGYILKGIEPVQDKRQNDYGLASRILYIASVSFVAIGLFCSFGGWHEEQETDVIWGSMIIQAVGIAGYFIGKLLSGSKPPIAVDWLNIIGILFMPVSMLTGILSIFVFKQGQVAPYPTGVLHSVLFAAAYLGLSAISFILIKKRRLSTQSTAA